MVWLIEIHDPVHWEVILQSRRDCIRQPRVARPTSYPGWHAQHFPQPQRGCITSLQVARRGRTMQPFQGCPRFPPRTQGSSQTRNPGLNDGIPLGFTMERRSLVCFHGDFRSLNGVIHPVIRSFGGKGAKRFEEIGRGLGCFAHWKVSHRAPACEPVAASTALPARAPRNGHTAVRMDWDTRSWEFCENECNPVLPSLAS